ncbi:MAG: beta-glucosidase [Pyrinomonadaceae bacterium]|nr:beta-glucosidase [Phycisphaerales bacterium]
MSNHLFPSGFVWGAASSSYQIEGAHEAGGRGPSVWDTFCQKDGAVSGGQNGNTACDHYHLWRDDVRLMRSIGLHAYRLSISWPRVMPDGSGATSAAGLAFYDALIDGLLDAGIEPWVTLFHWDYPYGLQCRGGWLNPDSPRWFAEYTQVIVDQLSDRVRNWMTINEPQIYIGMGHGDGTHAPGLKLSLQDRLLASHHTLLAHGLSVQTIRAHAKLKPTIGWAPCGRIEYPAVENAANIEAARQSTFSITGRDSWNNTWFADPVCLGRYPEDGLALFGAAAPDVRDGDMETINQPLDFYGLNIYSGDPVTAGPGGTAHRETFPVGWPQTAMKWFVAPESLRWGARFMHERYGLPIVITENGMANLDWPDEEGNVRDPQRIDYTRRYLLSLHQAILEGADVRGYFHWSIMDNFEWAEGYSKRFGLIHVDFATMKRTLKDSAKWYAGVITSNGGDLAGHDQHDVPSVRVRTVNGMHPVAPEDA